MALFPLRPKSSFDELQAAVKPKGHTRFSAFSLRNISSVLVRFRAFTVGDFTRCAVAGRLLPTIDTEELYLFIIIHIL